MVGSCQLVFESLTLTEGVLSYKLKFPFNEFVDSNILMARAAQAYEPNQTLINQCLTRNDNENVQFGSLKSLEPQIIEKKEEVTLKNATSLQIGDANFAVYGLNKLYFIRSSFAFFMCLILSCDFCSFLAKIAVFFSAVSSNQGESLGGSL